MSLCPFPISAPTLVATINLSRLLRAFIHLPMIVSDSPPLLPGAQREYTSAVSMQLKPLSANESSIAKDCCSSSVQPNTFPPNTSGAIYRLLLPNCRFSILLILERREQQKRCL